MTRKETIFTVLVLSMISGCIYGLQVLLFHDLRNRELYIMQDLAFIRISIAITTVVVGNIVARRSREIMLHYTQELNVRTMFFSDIGRILMKKINAISEPSIPVYSGKGMSVQKQQEIIRSTAAAVHTDRDTYEFIRAFLNEKKQDLITLSGNNNLMDQDDFTQLLGGLFHLLDEFSLRGSFEELSESDISHMNDDFARVLILLGTNLAASAEFQRKHFPDFYQKAIGRVKSGEEG